MFIKKKYLIRTHKKCSSLRAESKTVDFNFKSLNGCPTLKFESQISDFQSYEVQLREQLKKVGYSSWPWNKNKMYFSIANNLDEVQMRCFFDSADHVDASESYLLKENIAIMLNEKLVHHQLKQTCIVGLFDSKIEFSVMLQLKFLFIKTIHSDTEILINTQIENIVNRNLKIIRSKFPKCKMLVIDDREGEPPALLRGYEQIRDKDALIMSGLNKASIENIGQLYNRLKL